MPECASVSQTSKMRKTSPSKPAVWTIKPSGGSVRFIVSLTLSYPVVLRSPGSLSNSWMYAIAIEASLLREIDPTTALPGTQKDTPA